MAMKIDHLLLNETGLFSSLVLDYISHREDMQPFTAYTPDLEGVHARIAQLQSESTDNSTLVTVLREQIGSDLTPQQGSYLEELASGKGLTVCTGHQLNLFTGPLYMMHKVASVFSLCKRLRAEHGIAAVPVFWMASEDHDIDEIDHTTVFGKDIKTETDYQGAAGAWPLENIEPAIVELGNILGDSDKAQELMTIMRKAYRPEQNMAQAMRSIMQSLFGEQGLIIIDAADARLKHLFKSTMQAEVKEGQVREAALKSIAMLEHRGEQAQAHPRDINLFYMRPGIRARLSHDGGRVFAVDTELSWSLDEVLAELYEHPERFSPNVLMRPIYQESILPNIAYIGGPGELSYWLELKPVFEAFDMHMPVLLMRDIVLWMDERSEEQIKEMGFSLSDMFRDEAILHKEFALAHAVEEPDLGEDKEILIARFEKLIERSRIIDPSIAGFAKGEQQRLINSVDNIQKKLVRAEKKKHSDSLTRITILRDKILPGGGLMERKENFSSLYVRHGRSFIDHLMEAADPLDVRLKVITL